MSYKQKEKAKTPKDRKLALKHLKETAKLAKKKVKEHLKAAKSKGYDKGYNMAHASDHRKEVKEISESIKAYRKGMSKSKY